MCCCGSPACGALTKAPCGSCGANRDARQRHTCNTLQANATRHVRCNRFVLSQPRSVANPAGALHGACTAAIFDAVATAAVARRKDSSVGVGVTTQLSVMYGVAGAGRITFSTELLHLDHVAAVVAVDARDEKERVVARGTVVKRVSAYVDPPGGADLAAAPVMRV